MKLLEIREKKVIRKFTQVCRGINAYGKKMPIEMALRILHGTATLEDILFQIDVHRVGAWWYAMGEDGDADVEDSQDFARKEDDLSSKFGRNCLDDAIKKKQKTFDIEVPVVLIGKRPGDWDPEEDNPSNGLMGNSYINPRKYKKIELEEVQYYSGEGKWVTLPAKGKWVTLVKSRKNDETV
jgi:hypothetical protein